MAELKVNFDHKHMECKDCGMLWKELKQTKPPTRVGWELGGTCPRCGFTGIETARRT